MLNSDSVSKTQIAKDIEDTVRFEQRLAKGSSEDEDRRDHFGLYNKMTLRQLQQRYPGVSLSFLTFSIIALTFILVKIAYMNLKTVLIPRIT